MKFVPKRDLILGRVVDVTSTDAGLELPDVKVSVTCFVLVDAIGEDVKRCKVGDVVLYRQLQHVHLRDGTHAVVCKDDDIWLAVEDLDLRRCTVGGIKQRRPEPHAGA